MEKIIFRIDEMMRLCTGKDVLHLGYVQHSHLYRKLIENGTWVHMNLASVARDITGIDYLKPDVEILRSEFGYDGFFGDANKLEEVSLNRTFDVIVCGELIEHITNPGLMLEGLKRFMHKDSILIVTTPNPWGKNFIKLVNSNKAEESWVNEEHICWYSYFTLKNMLDRHGFREESYGYYFGFETEKQFFTISPGIAGILSKIKRKWMIFSTRQQNQLGLFFVAGL